MSSSPRPPEAPEQQSALLPIMMNMLVNRQNTSSPFGGQEYGSVGPDGEFIPFNASDPAVIAAITRAFADPANPDIGAFLSAMPTSARTFETDRTRSIREGGENQDAQRRAIAAQYMGRMAVPFGLPGGMEPEDDMNKRLELGDKEDVPPSMVPMLPAFPTKNPLELAFYSDWFRRG